MSYCLLVNQILSRVDDLFCVDIKKAGTITYNLYKTLYLRVCAIYIDDLLEKQHSSKILKHFKTENINKVNLFQPNLRKPL